ncbi:hypothetical protein F511_15133 [Dorcoceras hygrometricum]|uniref:Uncharacterized protein n=1 Tax=Dorcoceras hygrometricum TaxID=472368 RepID=A0A2Z7CEF4_9LAMI|nr:hypothetical protein F511_15133 [Dorcoceras hygrometricum]
MGTVNSAFGRSTQLLVSQLRFWSINSDSGRFWSVNSASGRSTQILDNQQPTVSSQLRYVQSAASSQLKSGNGQLSFDWENSDFGFRFHFRRLFCNPMEMAPSVPRTRAAAALRMKQIDLDNQSRTIRRLRVQLATERRGMKAKKRHTRESHLECHHKWRARIQEAKDSLQAQHLIIKALVQEKDSLIQTIQGLQEANGAPAPFDDDWEEEPEETWNKKRSRM